MMDRFDWDCFKVFIAALVPNALSITDVKEMVNIFVALVSGFYILKKLFKKPNTLQGWQKKMEKEETTTL